MTTKTVSQDVEYTSNTYIEDGTVVISYQLLVCKVLVSKAIAVMADTVSAYKVNGVTCTAHAFRNWLLTVWESQYGQDW